MFLYVGVDTARIADRVLHRLDSVTRKRAGDCTVHASTGPGVSSLVEGIETSLHATGLGILRLRIDGRRERTYRFVDASSLVGLEQISAEEATGDEALAPGVPKTPVP